METVLQQGRSEKISQALTFPISEYSAPYRYSGLCGMALLKEWLNGEGFFLP